MLSVWPLGLIFKSVVYLTVISLPQSKSQFYTFYNFLLIIFQYLTSHTQGALSAGLPRDTHANVSFSMDVDTYRVPRDVGLEVPTQCGEAGGGTGGRSHPRLFTWPSSQLLSPADKLACC